MNSIPLAVTRWLLICAAFIAACYSAIFARASFLFKQDTATSVPAAVSLVPFDSAYLARLAIWFPEKKSPLLHRAVELNPFAAESWIQLGLSAEMQQKDARAAERYYLKAAAVDRMFLPKWTLANFYFRRQDEANFFRWAKATLAITPYPPQPVFEQMWLFTQDASKIASTIPERPRILIEYSIFLANAHQFDALPPIVARLVRTTGSSNPEGAGRDGVIAPIEDRLLASGDLAPALKIWNSMYEGHWVALPAPTSAAPLTNADFHALFFGHGFDWIPSYSPNIRIEQIPDQKEVRFALSGGEPEQCVLLAQYLPLDPAHSYRLAWQAKAEGIEPPSGLRWRVHPIDNSSEPDVTSGDLFADSNGAWNFTPEHGAKTFLLSLEYLRPLGKTLLNGSFSLQTVTLNEQ